MAVLPCCAEEDVEAGSAALRVDWPVYPRRAEHNTVAEGGNRRWAETAQRPPQDRTQGPVGVVELADDPEDRVRPAQQDRQRRVHRRLDHGGMSPNWEIQRRSRLSRRMTPAILACPARSSTDARSASARVPARSGQRLANFPPRRDRPVGRWRERLERSCTGLWTGRTPAAAASGTENSPFGLFSASRLLDSGRLDPLPALVVQRLPSLSSP